MFMACLAFNKLKSAEEKFAVEISYSSGISDVGKKKPNKTNSILWSMFGCTGLNTYLLKCGCNTL